MSVRTPRGLVVTVIAVALVGLGSLARGGLHARADQPQPGQQLFDNARRAAEEHDFAGIVEVSWSDAAGRHRSDVVVRSANGVLALGDRPQVIIEGAQRFVQSPSGWLTVWGQSTRVAVPPASAKWDLRVQNGPDVAGRSTREVDAAHRGGGRIRERLYFDDATGLLLRREQLDGHGRVERTIGFTTIGDTGGMFLGPGQAPQPPAHSASRQPRNLDDVTAPFEAPGTTGDAFRLVGRYGESGDTVHLFYSDGLFSVSVFEQQGALDWSSLPPGGEPRTVSGRDAREYRTAGGVVTVWQAGDVVYTTVSDAPSDQVDGVLHAFQPSGSPDLLHRITDFVVGPFSW
jgi:sigma-E factor negative regulatory protein RseB